MGEPYFLRLGEVVTSPTSAIVTECVDLVRKPGWCVPRPYCLRALSDGRQFFASQLMRLSFPLVLLSTAFALLYFGHRDAQAVSRCYDRHSVEYCRVIFYGR